MRPSISGGCGCLNCDAEKFVSLDTSVQSVSARSTSSASVLTEFTGENFDSSSRRCQGLMILCIEEAAGGSFKWVSQNVLYPLLRQRCNFPESILGNAIGRFIYALRQRNPNGVLRKEERGIVFYSVKQELADKVHAGKFGELPFGMFVSQPDDVSLSGTVIMTPAEPSAPPTYEELEQQLATALARVAALESTNEFLKGELEALEGGEIVLPKKG